MFRRGNIGVGCIIYIKVMILGALLFRMEVHSSNSLCDISFGALFL